MFKKIAHSVIIVMLKNTEKDIFINKMFMPKELNPTNDIDAIIANISFTTRILLKSIAMLKDLSMKQLNVLLPLVTV